MKRGEELQMSVRFPASVGVTVDDDPIEGVGLGVWRCLEPVQVEMAYVMCPNHSKAWGSRERPGPETGAFFQRDECHQPQSIWHAARRAQDGTLIPGTVI